MAPRWQPGEQYNYGDVVEFEGVEYKIIQPHRSQGDWTPPVTPALWGRIEGGGHHRPHHREERWGEDRKSSTDYVQQRVEVDQVSYQSSVTQSAEQEKHWYNVDDKTKKELEIGGGILAGTAALGAGYYAYKQHEGKKEHGDQAPYQAPQEQQKHWYDVDDGTKKKLEVGAGLAAGAAAIGVGYHAYKQHEEKKEEQQQRQEHGQVSYQSGVQPPEQEKHWYDMDDGTKKKLEIGAGLAAGAAVLGAGYHAYKQHEEKKEEQRQEYDQAPYKSAVQPAPEQEKHWYDDNKGKIVAGVALAGAGYLAYKHHQANKEEEEVQKWSQDRWIQDSRVRTQQWRAGQYNEPVAWIWNEGKSIPRDAIQGGEERGETLYICRVYHEGGLYVGKACRVFKKGAVIGYGHKEYHFDEYEILVGDARAVKWVNCSGQFNPQSLGARPVEGGREADGPPIYIAQAPHHGAVHPGKACETYGDGCFIPYDNSEKKIKEYAVLCYAN